MKYTLTLPNFWTLKANYWNFKSPSTNVPIKMLSLSSLFLVIWKNKSPRIWSVKSRQKHMTLRPIWVAIIMQFTFNLTLKRRKSKLFRLTIRESNRKCFRLLLEIVSLHLRQVKRVKNFCKTCPNKTCQNWSCRSRTRDWKKSWGSWRIYRYRTRILNESTRRQTKKHNRITKRSTRRWKNSTINWNRRISKF